ncbi:hypothetical protein BG004_003185 [Podila humilis]|nr:hypothetical protein BG004_003185 [Podila humilis]
MEAILDDEDDDDEEKQLKMALELSLRESNTGSMEHESKTSLTKPEVILPTAPGSGIPTAGSLTSISAALGGMSRAEMERERQERLERMERARRKRPSSEMEEETSINTDTITATTTTTTTTTSNTTDQKTLSFKRHTGELSVSSDTSGGDNNNSRFSKFSSPLVSSSKVAIASPFAPEPTPTLESSVRKHSQPKLSTSSSSLSSPTSPMAVKSELISSYSYLSPTATAIPATTSTKKTPTKKNTPPQQTKVEPFEGFEDMYPIQYEQATFKNTYINGQPMGPHTIRIEDLIDRDYIQRAVITSFELDPVWLEKYLPRSVPQCLVKHWSAKHGEMPGYRRLGKVIELHPPLSGFGTFHPKLMLLFYNHFCRVVVCSGNMVPHDWEEMVNSLYVQDFPMLPELVHLIPTVQGSYPVYADHTYGIARFAKVMADLNPQHQPWSIEYQTSSLGKLTAKFLSEFDKASQGLPVRTRSRLDPEELLPDIKVVFPTEQTVQESRNGEMGGGTVCFGEQYWAASSFPKKVLCDFQCVGNMYGSLMHSKLVLGYSNNNRKGNSLASSSSTSTLASSSPRPAGWFYVGSANFTESAWGTIIKKTIAGAQRPVAVTASSMPTPAAAQGLQVSMRNWELGVLYLIEDEQEMNILQGKRSLRDKTNGINFFGPMPIPYKRPIEPYSSQDRPWFKAG